jgi:hypothetical protein
LDGTVDILSQLRFFESQGWIRESDVEAPDILQRYGRHRLAASLPVAVPDDDATKPARKGGRVA